MPTSNTIPENGVMAAVNAHDAFVSNNFRRGVLRWINSCSAREARVSASASDFSASATRLSSAVLARLANRNSPQTPNPINTSAAMVSHLRHVSFGTNAAPTSTTNPTNINRAILSAQSELNSEIDLKSFSFDLNILGLIRPRGTHSELTIRLWALPDMPKPHQRFYRGFPAGSLVAYSLNQILVRQPLAYRRIDEAREPPCSVPSYITLVETEGELVNVPAKMLCADMMEGAVDASLAHLDG
jgi:hypothetical protein